MKNITKILFIVLMAFVTMGYCATNVVTNTTAQVQAPATSQYLWSTALWVDGITSMSPEKSYRTYFGPTISLSLEAPFIPHVPVELGVRQGIKYSSDQNCTLLNTEAFADLNVKLSKRWVVYAGPVFKVLYGTCTTGNQTIGPELGVKYYIWEHLFVTGKGSYDFSINDIESRKSDYVGYSLALGFSW
jgi:hypothetical protein